MTKAKDLPNVLTQDKQVRKCMTSIQTVGFLALICAVLVPISLVLAVQAKLIELNWLSVFIVIAIFSYFIYSAIKFNNLRGGRSIQVILILNIIIGLLLVRGIFPLLLVIYSILALSKIRCYLNWYDEKHKKKDVSKQVEKPRHITSSVAQNKISSKVKFEKRWIISIVLMLIIIPCLILSGDFINYKIGNRSLFFGTLDVYEQKQTLKFKDLDLKVNDVTIKLYQLPTLPDTNCSDLYANANNTTGRLFNNPSLLCNYRTEYEKDNYNNSLNHSKLKNEIIVEFQYLNISDKPINLSDYKIKLVANTSLEDSVYSSKACSGISSNHAFLKVYTEKECLAKDIDKGYNGPLALSVTNGDKDKIINLNIPSATN